LYNSYNPLTFAPDSIRSLLIVKTGIEKELLEIARKEFFEKGFKGTSVRNIAQKAGITFSNIYYYYENKDAMFLEVVKPLKDKLDNMFGIWHDIDPAYITIEAYTDEEYQKQSVETLMKLIQQYKKEFNLLLFNAHGSVVEDIQKKYIDSATQSGMAYLKKLEEKYPELNINTSEVFIRTMSAHIFTIIGEIVSQDLSADEIKRFMEDLVAFNTMGWKGILYKNKKYEEKLSYAI